MIQIKIVLHFIGKVCKYVLSLCRSFRSVVLYKKKGSKKFHKINRKTPVLKSFSIELHVAIMQI